MRDYQKVLDWEYECYKGRKPNPYRIAYLLSIIAWVIFVIALALTTEKTEAEPVQETVPETIVTEAEPQLYQKAAIDQVDEPDDQVDLTKLKQVENATVTAYCICEICCGKDESHPAYGITASGRPAEPFVSVAVDPFVIPLGRTVYLDYGDGVLHEFRADDTGGAVAGAHIDVCYPDHESALEHGVQTARVWWEEE